jgi:hypothetical protein
VLPAVGGGLLGLGLVASGFAANSNASITVGPDLKPIAIPVRACPYLNVVQVMAAAGQAFWDEPDAFKDLGTPASDHRLDAILAPLDFALRATATQVPARLRVQLLETATQVEIGRALIAYRQTTGPSFIDALFDGDISLTNASDLVGGACGFTLAA